MIEPKGKKKKPKKLLCKESASNVGNLGSIPGLGRSPGGRHWQPTPVFLPVESPWTEEPGGLTIHEVTKSWTGMRTKHSAYSLLKFHSGLRITVLGKGSVLHKITVLPSKPNPQSLSNVVCKLQEDYHSKETGKTFSLCCCQVASVVSDS